MTQIDQHLKAGRYNEVLKLLNVTFSENLPNSELVKIASFCEVNTQQYAKAISRLSQALGRFKDDVGLTISLMFAYANNGDVENASKTALLLTPQTQFSSSHLNELLFFLQEFSLRRYAVSRVVGAIYHNERKVNRDDEKALRQLLYIAKTTQLWEMTLTLSKRLYQLSRSNTLIIEQAIALRFLNRPSEAVTLLKPLSRSLNHYAVFHNLANMYADIGELRQASTLYERAIKLNPDYVESLVNHAKVAFELGNTKTWLTLFEQVIRKKARSIPHCTAYINLLLEGKNFAKALVTIDQLLVNYDKTISALLKAKTLRLQNKPSEALEALAPFELSNIAEINLELAENALILKDLPLATQQLNHLEKHAVKDFSIQQVVRSNTYIIERLKGLPVESKLKDTVWQRRAPDEVVAMPALRDYLEKLHARLSSPVSQSVRNGTQTRGNFFPTTNNSFKALEKFFKCQIADFIKANISYLNIADNVDISEDTIEFSGSWSVLNKSDGFHVPHYHSKGLVSGVFYVDVPRELSNIDNAGHLYLGRVDKTPFYQVEQFATVKPENGKLVMFPSHMWHGTFPTKQEGIRLTVAFDAILV